VYKNEYWKCCPYRYDTVVWFIINNDRNIHDLMLDVQSGDLDKTTAAEIVAKEYKLRINGAKKVVKRVLDDFNDNDE
jgi:hypothetical protein